MTSRTAAEQFDRPGPILPRHQSFVTKSVLPLAGVALIVALALSQRHLLGESASVLLAVHWVWIAPALTCEAGSLIAFGLVQRRLLNVGGIGIGVRSVAAITLVAKAISSLLPLAGAEMGTAYTYRRFRHHRADGVTAAWVLTVSGVVSTVTFAAIVSAAAVATDNLGAICAGLASAILTLLGVGGAVVAFRRPALRCRLARVATWGLRLGRRITGRQRGDGDAVVKEAIDRLSSFRVNRRDVNYVALTSSANWLGDILCLAFAAAAFENHLPWPAIVLAWSAGSVATSLQITPGGLGVVEAALTSALVVAGLHPGHAAAAALTYRAMSYWIPSVAGLAVLGAQRRVASTSPKSRFETSHRGEDYDSRQSEADLISSPHPFRTTAANDVSQVQLT
jgi:putative heme transporter